MKPDDQAANTNDDHDHFNQGCLIIRRIVGIFPFHISLKPRLDNNKYSYDNRKDKRLICKKDITDQKGGNRAKAQDPVPFFVKIVNMVIGKPLLFIRLHPPAGEKRNESEKT